MSDDKPVERPNWPHQDRGKKLVYERRQAGVKRICGVAPPGAGKTTCMAQLAREEVERGGKVAIYLHRTMLLEQMSEVFTNQGLDHGIFAQGYKRTGEHPIEMAMMDTAYSRSVKRGTADLHDATLVLVDEFHQQRGNKARAVLDGAIGDTRFDGHTKRGACVIGFTGTPVGLADACDELVSFGSYSELREVKAHLPVRVYTPSEIDCTGLARNADFEFGSKALEPRVAKIIGDCYANWRELNPFAEPAILFGPSVSGAFWFAEEFMRRGVKTAAVGDGVAMIPELQASGNWQLVQHPLDKDTRAEVLRLSRTGEIAVLCNRFILREAIDMPWLRHGIFATVFGSVASYLQSVGRIQRYWADYPDKILQDHGGCYWRHGSPNQDRDWKLGDTSKDISEARMNRFKNGQEPEPIQCPNCKGWRTSGEVCPHCKHQHKRSVRRVMQENGKLKLVEGPLFKKQGKKATSHQKIWNGLLWMSAHTNQPFSSLVQMFHSRCKKEGVPSVNPRLLKNPPPDAASPAYHLPARRTYGWLRPRAGRK